MAVYEFQCIDAHTCGNPVRLVAEGGPDLKGDSMAEKRLHFLEEYDWIRKGLMFEPRGHDMMSGSILYPPSDPENDVGVLFIETSGCLPMCGHGTIGTVTIAIEKGLVKPKRPETLRLETPAGLVRVEYRMDGNRVSAVKLTNVPSFLYKESLKASCPGLGDIYADVAYGGNFYAIVDAQKNYSGLQNYEVSDLLRWSRILRSEWNRNYNFRHPLDENIQGLSHILWTGAPLDERSTARNAVFYGDNAMDRSPCGTGTSARMAQWYAKGWLKPGEDFIHESVIGSKFTGSIEQETEVGDYKAIVPSVQGWARIYGTNVITIDDDDPYAHGFQVI